jgi:hypothetical protein
MGVLLFILGLAVALGSQPIVKWFVQWVRTKSGVPIDREGEGVPPWIVGTFERLLAFALIFFDVEQALTVLIAWMAAKLAANWQRQTLAGDESEADRKIRIYTLTALMAGTLSLAFGVLGGAIARGFR